MTFRVSWLILSLASVISTAALADDLDFESIDPAANPAAVDSSPDDDDASAPDTDDGQIMRLSLDESIRYALENNLDVEVQRFTPMIAGEFETQAWGAYDPEFFAEFGYADIEHPSSFVLDGQLLSSGDLYDGVGGIRGLLPYLGSEYNFQFSGERSTTNNVVQSYSPELRSSFSFAVTQPLLRGLIWNEAWTRVKTSRVIYDESLENFRRRVMDTVQEVEDAYWNLIATSEQMRVAEKSLETARALLDQTKTQYDVGVISKVEVVEAEAGVADRDFNLIAADNRYRTAQDRLINLVFSTDLTPDSTLRIDPSDPPKDFVAYQVDAMEATQLAFQQRPELKIADDEIELRKLELRFAKNERLPALDIQFAYGNRGLSGKQNPSAIGAVPPEGNFADTLDNYFSGSAAEQISARALLSIPIPNTTARSQVSQGELELRRATVEKRRLEQDIILEVRKAVRDLNSSLEGIEAAQRASEASAEQLRAERIRLEYGESTPFDVLLREEDFVEAESREINAIRLYRTSVTGLSRAQGSILANRNIAIDEISAFR
jgi:outer membrane protein TolC